MSSTHDPYLPELAPWASVILRHALPAGVNICLQTRSYLVLRDLEYLASHRSQVRLQVSIATADPAFARLIEPRVPPPGRRLEVLRRAKEAGLSTGVIIAPVFPRVGRDGARVRDDPAADLRAIAEELADIRPAHIYGESLHARGQNMALVRERVGELLYPDPGGWDAEAEGMFHSALAEHGLAGTWWPEGRA